MGPGFMGGPPPAHSQNENRVAPPKSIGDIPRFIKEIVGGFFSRLFYIFKMVWQTGRWILISLLAIAILEGTLPIIGSLLSRDILNELQNIISSRVAAELSGAAFTTVFWGSMVMFLLIFYFAYKIINQLVVRVNVAVTRIAGEKVVRHVKVQMMNKAKEIDLASFDRPEFYEKLENADREASTRPISVLAATFDSLTKTITLVSYIIILATAPDMWWTAIVMLVVSIPSAAINFSYRKKNFNFPQPEKYGKVPEPAPDKRFLECRTRIRSENGKTNRNRSDPCQHIPIDPRKCQRKARSAERKKKIFNSDSKSAQAEHAEFIHHWNTAFRQKVLIARSSLAFVRMALSRSSARSRM